MFLLQIKISDFSLHFRLLWTRCLDCWMQVMLLEGLTPPIVPSTALNYKNSLKVSTIFYLLNFFRCVGKVENQAAFLLNFPSNTL